MRAVVTGGAGFIGSNLVDALVARGDDVTVVDNFATGKREHLNAAGDAARARHPRAVRGRRRRRLPPRRAGRRPDVDAAPGLRRRGQRRRHGERARRPRRGAQVIFASSGGAGYGECAAPADEETPFLPLSPYGIAKKCGEEYLAGWNRIHGTSHVALRFANVYGPRQDAGPRGRRRRDLPRAPRARRGDGRSTATAARAATSSTSATSSPRCSRRSGTSGGPYNVGTGAGHDGRAAARRVRARSPAATPSRGSRPRGSATSAARCSTSR